MLGRRNSTFPKKFFNEMIRMWSDVCAKVPSETQVGNQSECPESRTEAMCHHCKGDTETCQTHNEYT